jgi:phage-related protein
MSNILIKYDDFDITESVETIELSTPMNIQPMKVPKRHGAIISEVPTLDPRRISIKGRIQEQDYDTLRDTIENYEKVFLGRFNKKFRIYDDKYIYAYPLSFNYKPIEGTVLASADYSIDLFCADPFWQSDTAFSDSRTLDTSDTAIDITNNIYRESFTLTNSGNAFIYPKFTITATSTLTMVIIRNITTGRNMTYSGTVAAGKILVIDCANFIITNDGAEDLTNFSGSFMWLTPGDNSFQYEGTTIAVYVAEFIPRYY